MIKLISRLLVQYVYKFEKVSVKNINEFSALIAKANGYKLLNPIMLYKEYRKLQTYKRG